MEITRTDLADLSVPFAVKDVQWRAGATTRDKKKAQALAYVDPRIYEARLDEVFGGNWSVHFRPWGESRVICELNILNSTRSSSGEFDDSDRVSQGPTAEAQAFKRACSKFGLGRYLYDLPTSWVPYDESKRKLLETPKIPQRYHPEGYTTPQPRPTTPPPPPIDAIGSERADKMQDALDALGLTTHEVTKLINIVTGQPSVPLENLNENDAATIYTMAKSSQVAP